MTDTEIQPETQPVTGTRSPAELAADPQVRALVLQGMAQVAEGKLSLADLFDSVMAKPEGEAVDLKPPVPPKLTDAQRAALMLLPEVYGKTVVTAVRKLTTKEATALIEERETIDAILGVLEKRKSESIREVLANHMDAILDEDTKDTARRDSHGHYAVKHEDPVEGTGKKIQRSVSGGKPRLTIAQVEALHETGQIDRKTYLAITRRPDNPRVLDEEGLHKTIQKDPALFFLLGFAAEPTTPTTTIKIVADK